MGEGCLIAGAVLDGGGMLDGGGLLHVYRGGLFNGWRCATASWWAVITHGY